MLYSTTEIKSKVEALNGLAKEYLAKDIPLSMKYTINALRISEKNNLLKQKGDCHHLLGAGNQYKGKLTEAIYHYQIALRIKNEFFDKNGISNIYNNLGVIYLRTDNYAKALNYLKESLLLKKELENTSAIGNSYLNIGNAYLAYDKIKESLHNYQLAYEIFKAQHDYQKLAFTLNNTGNIYRKGNNTFMALKCYKKCLKLSRKYKNKQAEANALNNIGGIYFSEKNYDKAFKYYDLAKNIFKELNFKTKYAGTLENIALIFWRQNKIKQAETIFKECLQFAEKQESLDNLEHIYKNVEQFYEDKKDYKMALFYQKEWNRVSVLNQKRKNQKATDSKELKQEIRIKEQQAEIYKLKNIELEKANNRLKNTQAKLVMAEKMAALGNLVAGVAHEMNTPVSIAKLAGEEIERSIKQFFPTKVLEKIPEKQKDMVNSILESSNLINRNLNRTSELIKYFKQTSYDHYTEEKRKIDFKSLLRTIFKSLVNKKQLKIKLNIKGPDTFIFESYPGVITSIFTNLIQNSIQHGFKNSIEGEITISFFKLNDFMFISYSDTGRGLVDCDKTKIFDPFYTTDMQNGTGLGLNIVYNSIKGKLKGNIEYQESKKEQKGILFKITIPLKG